MMKSWVPEHSVALNGDTCLKDPRCNKNSTCWNIFFKPDDIKFTEHANVNFKFRKTNLYLFPMAIMLLMQSNINTDIFIIVITKHYSRNKNNYTNYSFKYPQPIAVFTYSEHFPVMITAMIQLIGTSKSILKIPFIRYYSNYYISRRLHQRLNIHNNTQI